MAKAPRVSGSATQFAKKNVAATPAAPTAPSATYVQAEATSMKTAVDAIRNALKAAGITT